MKRKKEKTKGRRLSTGEHERCTQKQREPFRVTVSVHEYGSRRHARGGSGWAYWRE